MKAATRVIANQGLNAPTAMIAKEAGVSNGSLFTYFATKAELLNALYLALKAEMAAALDLLPEGDVRERLRHAWLHWLRWACSSPEKRCALARLDVSGDITPASRQSAGRMLAHLRDLLDDCRRHGPMRNAPPAFVAGLMSALADATTDFMIGDPAGADAHADAGFEALWRVVA